MPPLTGKRKFRPTGSAARSGIVASASLDWRVARFCERFAECGNALQAALDAGWTGTTADDKARILIHREDVRAEIARLRGDTIPWAQMSEGERRSRLSEWARDQYQDTQDRIKSIDTLNKMDRLYTPETASQTTNNTQINIVVNWDGNEALPIPIDAPVGRVAQCPPVTLTDGQDSGGQ